jgi:hypothetical protein
VAQQERKAAVESLRQKFKGLERALDERTVRLWAATEARALGWGGVSRVSEATGLTRPTIHRGLQELDEEVGLSREERSVDRVRQTGGGRRKLVEQNPRLRDELELLVDPATRGDPMSPLRWTSKSTAKLAAELTRRGYEVSDRTVAHLLREMDYSLQSNRKSREGKQHPDRDAQFRYINRLAKRFIRAGNPVISVDTKKKELVGDFKNGGREWQPKGRPEKVRTHDFKDKKLGKVIPYGIYDIDRNEGWVSVGIDHDTAEFATSSICTWWKRMGCKVYPDAEALLITADSGGSNGSRTRLWKVALQRLANDIGLRITVCHFPPGTSKWNKIEHRMFCHITENWRGRPLLSREVAVNLIASTRTAKGLTIKAKLDRRKYPTGMKVSDDELSQVNLKRAKFHGDWNYTVSPVNL